MCPGALTPRNPESWIRVGLDTGGIAAGGQTSAPCAQARVLGEGGAALPVWKTGSYGYAYLDPVVEVCTPELGTVLYGLIEETIASRIVDEHVCHGKLLQDRVVASPLGG